MLPPHYSSSSSSSSNPTSSEVMGGEKYLLGSLGRYGVGGKHAAFQLASSVTVSTRPRGAPFVYEATLDASVLSSSSSSKCSASSTKGSNALLKGRQHTWVAELRVRAATPEEESMQLPSWTRLELRRLKPGLISLSGSESDAGELWDGTGVRKSLANLYVKYGMKSPDSFLFFRLASSLSPLTESFRNALLSSCAAFISIYFRTLCPFSRRKEPGRAVVSMQVVTLLLERRSGGGTLNRSLR